RAFAKDPPGAVLDGRDIGTVIAPDADVKIFVTASVQERARRRARELAARGIAANEAEVLADIERRDERDRSRAVAPLAPAPDAPADIGRVSVGAGLRAAPCLAAAGRAVRGGGSSRPPRAPPAGRGGGAGGVAVVRLPPPASARGARKKNPPRPLV